MRNVASNKLTHMYLRKIPLESHQTLDERLSVVSGKLVIYWSYGNSGSESLFWSITKDRGLWWRRGGSNPGPPHCERELVGSTDYYTFPYVTLNSTKQP